MLTVAGDQLPKMPLVELVGKTGAVFPLQISGKAVNVGVVFGVIVCVSVDETAH